MFLKPKASPLDQNTIKKCSHCKKVKDCIYHCQNCKTVFYCSAQCKEQDYKSSHVNSCWIASIIMMNCQKESKNGRVGLENMGNTCYLNSCIQCLSHTKQLTTYFLNKYYKEQINQQNILGLKGQLANAYYTCIYNLWAQNKQTYRPDMLKRIIGRKNDQFSTFQQQDASQLFATVIDGIHEDLNRSKRIFKAMPDIYGKSDQEGARISWLHFLLNNQSIIVDTMTGLFKSVITCPSCSHVSIKFDTFNMINLPIPEFNEIKRLKFYVMYFQKPTIKCEIEFQEINFQKFKIQAARTIKRNHNDFKLYFLSQKRQIHELQNLKIQQFHKLFALDKVYLLQLTPEERQITNKFSLTCSFCTRKQGKFYNFWLKRPFFIDLNSETGLSFTKSILRFLYIFCYKERLKKTIYGVQGMQFQQYMKQMLSLANRPFKLLIVKTRKRVSDDYIITDVCYEKQLKMVTDQYLIRECIDYILKNDEEQNNPEGLEATPYNKKFQMIIEINEQTQKLFDFKKLLYQEQVEQKKQKNQINIYKCFDAFDCEENLTAEWYCEWCQTKKKINKRMNIYRSPDILVIVLNRFKVVENGTRTKNDKQVNFPFELDLDKYVLDHKPMNSWIKIAKKNIDYKKPSYNFQPNLHISQKFDLYAVVNHEGNLNFGHYYAYAKNQSKWYKFDDSRVTETHEMKQKYAYMLFYRRKKQ